VRRAKTLPGVTAAGLAYQRLAKRKLALNVDTKPETYALNHDVKLLRRENTYVPHQTNDWYCN
jgi:hypothetical protein